MFESIITSFSSLIYYRAVPFFYRSSIDVQRYSQSKEKNNRSSLRYASPHASTPARTALIDKSISFFVINRKSNFILEEK
jgi:hypothetical protein